MTEADQIEQQARTIKTLWVRMSKQKSRIEKQQAIIDSAHARIDYLEQQLTPQALAERVFNGKA